MKVCKKCNEEKPLTEFYKNRKWYNSRCKSCEKKSSVKAGVKWRNKIQGVYGIFDGETCLYVGESKKLNQRISDHKYRLKHPQGQKELYLALQKHTNIEFRILEKTPNHKEREKHYINKLAPKYNNMYV